MQSKNRFIWRCDGPKECRATSKVWFPSYVEALEAGFRHSNRTNHPVFVLTEYEEEDWTVCGYCPTCGGTNGNN